MINILLAGVGGQGTVLAAKVLAYAAQDKGWQVRTAETIGMAQRGGSVMSHVRMGNNGEYIFSPLITKASAHMIIAFEPAQAAAALPYLSPDGVVVSASSALAPVTAALSNVPYAPQGVLSNLDQLLGKRFVVVNDATLLQQVGSSKVLNTLMLAVAVKAGDIGVSLDNVRSAIQACVKPAFVDINFKAIAAVEHCVEHANEHAFEQG